MAISTRELNLPLGLPGRSTSTVDTVVVPNVAADIITGDVDVITMIFTNITASDATITLLDNNGKSFVFYNTVVSPGFPLMFEKPGGLRCTGALNWVCNTLNAVEGKIEYKLA